MTTCLNACRFCRNLVWYVYRRRVAQIHISGTCIEVELREWTSLVRVLNESCANTHLWYVYWRRVAQIHISGTCFEGELRRWTTLVCVKPLSEIVTGRKLKDRQQNLFSRKSATLWICGCLFCKNDLHFPREREAKIPLAESSICITAAGQQTTKTKRVDDDDVELHVHGCRLTY